MLMVFHAVSEVSTLNVMGTRGTKGEGRGDPAAFWWFNRLCVILQTFSKKKKIFLQMTEDLGYRVLGILNTSGLQ